MFDMGKVSHNSREGCWMRSEDTRQDAMVIDSLASHDADHSTGVERYLDGHEHQGPWRPHTAVAAGDMVSTCVRETTLHNTTWP